MIGNDETDRGAALTTLTSVCGQWQQSSLTNGDAVIMPYIYLCLKVHLA